MKKKSETRHMMPKEGRIKKTFSFWKVDVDEWERHATASLTKLIEDVMNKKFKKPK
jgi:hypothetical protein